MAHYVIEPKKPDDPTRMRVVESKTKAAALAHVVEDTLKVRLAEPMDFVSLTKAGGEIEKAE